MKEQKNFKLSSFFVLFLFFIPLHNHHEHIYEQIMTDRFSYQLLLMWLKD